MTTKLVSPEHIVYHVNSREELKELVRRLRIDEKLAGNLRQLCGWQDVGDDRSGRGHASGWTLLHLVRWLRREGIDTYIVAIGSAAQIRSAAAGLKEVTSSDDHVKKLLNGERKKWPTGWTCLPKGSMPIDADRVESGGSIDRLRVPGALQPAAPSMVAPSGGAQVSMSSRSVAARLLLAVPRAVTRCEPCVLTAVPPLV